MAQFDDVKVGDVVLVHTWMGSFHITHKYKPRKVVKVNKNTFKIENDDRTFNKYGSVYGSKDAWDRINLIKYDEEFYRKHLQEEEDREKRIKLLDGLHRIKFDTLTTEQLEQIKNIVGDPK